MKYRKTLLVMTLAIILLSAAASAAGLYTGGQKLSETVISVWGEQVELDGRGLYAHDSVSFASQGRAQDLVTLFIGIPMLFIGYRLYVKGNLKGLLLYPGTLAYFLYTYMTYAFLVNFNQLFLVYTSLLTLCLSTFILVLTQLDAEKASKAMAPRFYRKTISVYLSVVGFLILMMWLGRLIPALSGNTVPYGIDHYTTLGIQVLDLSVIVPLSFLTSVLLWKKKPWGYVLSGIVIFKALTLLLAILAMIISEAILGNPMIPLEVGIFLALILVNCILAALLFRAVPGHQPR